MSNNKYEIKKGIRNGAIAGPIAGLVLAVTMFATNTLDLSAIAYHSNHRCNIRCVDIE